MLQAKHKNIATALEFYHMTRRQRFDEIAQRLRKSLHDLRSTRCVIKIFGAWFFYAINLFDTNCWRDERFYQIRVSYPFREVGFHTLSEIDFLKVCIGFYCSDRYAYGGKSSTDSVCLRYALKNTNAHN